MKRNIKNNNNNVGTGLVFAQLKIITIISLILVIFFATALIINITTTNKSLDKIIYKAKKEAEQTLVSTGRVIYAENVQNYVGAGPVSAKNKNLPDNTSDNPQPEGTIVKPKDNWNIETVTAISVGGGAQSPYLKASTM